MDISIVKQIQSLNVYHLKIEYDSTNDNLIYKRKLESGSGPAIYGLEVCKSLDLGDDFHFYYVLSFKWKFLIYQKLLLLKKI